MLKGKWVYALAAVVTVAVIAEFFIIGSKSNKTADNNESNIIINNDEDVNIDDKEDKENKEDGNEDINDNESIEKTEDIPVQDRDYSNNKLFMLVNKQNLLDSTYVPDDLVLSQVEFLSYIETRSLSQETADAAKKMFDAALNDGITLLGASGYRSYDIQVGLYTSRSEQLGEEEAAKYTAPPGASEHQTGLALDILGADYQYMDDDFDKSESFKWLTENCYKYGFILRFLKGKEDITGYSYEPWHYRYIGDVEAAEYIMKNNLTLEEFLQK